MSEMKKILMAAAICGGVWFGSAMAGQVADLSQNGITITVESEPETIDPGRDFNVTITIKSPKGKSVETDYLRDRFKGFRVAEDFAEEPMTTADGAVVKTTHWRLEPEPLAKKRYRLAPFVVTVTEEDGKTSSFYTNKPVLFEPPAAREPVTGEEMEIAPKRDWPELNMKLVAIILMALAALTGTGYLVWLLICKLRLMVKVYRMSPVERAMYELEVLLGKGLPAKGMFKDFYVELTMVVRRYIERRYAMRAPNLTTEEFLLQVRGREEFPNEVVAELEKFLASADMIKFAGVEANAEMSDAATGKARDYLRKDDENNRKRDGAV